MSQAENYLPSTKLNTLSLDSVVHSPKSLFHQASQINRSFADNPLKIGFRGSRVAVLPKEWLPKLLNLPIDHLSAFTVIVSPLFSEVGSSTTFVWIDKLTAIMPAYPEWPLFFTTLRLLITGVLS